MAHRLHHPKVKKQVTADSKLKEFMEEDIAPVMQYVMPEYDYDGEDMYDYVEDYRNNEMHDGDYIEWYKTVDECVENLRPKGGFNYALTITFNRSFHTLPTMYNIDRHLHIIKYYVQECLGVEIKEWYGVLEYHKKPIKPLNKFPPHYHFLLNLDKELQPCDLQKTQAAFWRHFGKVDFLPETKCWLTYMCKNDKTRDDYGEFINNIKTYKKPHLFIIN